MRLALYQPDIPQNTGTILRMAACLDVGVDVIGPTGFDMTSRALKRAGMDYLAALDLARHLSWEDFLAARGDATSGTATSGTATSGRLILLTTKASHSYLDFNYRAADTLLLGRESAGVPPHVHAIADARLLIPLRPTMRSLNIAIASAIVLGEALRQTGGFADGRGGP